MVAIVSGPRVGKPRVAVLYFFLPGVELSAHPLPLPCSFLGHIDPFLQEVFQTCIWSFGLCLLRTLLPTYENLPGEEASPLNWDIFKC